MNTTEYVVNIAVAQGQSSAQEAFNPDPGKIIGAKIFYAALNNPGLVNASILGTNREEVSKPQHIDNYRDRNSAYTDCKPVDYQGAQRMYFRIDATEAFTQDFVAQLVLIYDNSNEQILQPC